MRTDVIMTATELASSFNQLHQAVFHPCPVPTFVYNKKQHALELLKDKLVIKAY